MKQHITIEQLKEVDFGKLLTLLEGAYRGEDKISCDLKSISEYIGIRKMKQILGKDEVCDCLWESVKLLLEVEE